MVQSVVNRVALRGHCVVYLLIRHSILGTLRILPEGGASLGQTILSLPGDLYVLPSPDGRAHLDWTLLSVACRNHGQCWSEQFHRSPRYYRCRGVVGDEDGWPHKDREIRTGNVPGSPASGHEHFGVSA